MSAQIIKWFVVTDNREYLISEKEKDGILKADIQGARFVQFDKAVVNIAHIKEIYRKIEYVDNISEVSANDTKYLVNTESSKMLI
jgi:hypothetical protein